MSCQHFVLHHCRAAFTAFASYGDAWVNRSTARNLVGEARRIAVAADGGGATTPSIATDGVGRALALWRQYRLIRMHSDPLDGYARSSLHELYRTDSHEQNCWTPLTAASFLQWPCAGKDEDELCLLDFSKTL